MFENGWRGIYCPLSFVSLYKISLNKSKMISYGGLDRHVRNFLHFRSLIFPFKEYSNMASVCDLAADPRSHKSRKTTGPFEWRM